MGRNAKFAVDMRVRVNRGDATDVRGVIVEDYGDHAGYSVDVGEDHIVDAARRWAVLLDSGTLVFADDAHLKPEPFENPVDEEGEPIHAEPDA